MTKEERGHLVEKQQLVGDLMIDELRYLAKGHDEEEAYPDETS